MASAQDKTLRSISLKLLIDCTLEQQTHVRELRNQQGVRSAMYTNHLISLDEHLSWIGSLTDDRKQIVFAVLNEEQRPIGVVSVNAIDTLHKKSDWAFYLDENERGGLGAALEFNLIEYVFNTLSMEKLNCEVIESNEAVVRLHKKFFFVEEGFRRSNIEKNGRRIGVFFLGLTKADWQANREQVAAKYQPILSKFQISIG